MSTKFLLRHYEKMLFYNIEFGRDTYKYNERSKALPVSENNEQSSVEMNTYANHEHRTILRAVYNLRTPDALQIATALEFNCQAFLTNDKQLQRVTELRVLILDELEL